MSASMVKVEDLHHGFNGTSVLKGVNLEVEEGERLVIIGRSGGGKSVLLKLIASLDKPRRGRVCIEGRNWVPLSERELTPLRKKIGILFQGAALFDSMTIYENVAFPLTVLEKISTSEIRQRVDEVLRLVELSGHGHKKPGEISGGMRKRAGLARAIVDRPDIMLYDEPTAGLDPVIADSINHLILKLSEKFKVTSIVVTHDMTSAYKIANRIAMLYEGKILESGTPAEIQNSKDPVVQKFVKGICDPSHLDF
jgi:phospholipid/cholesterol/gamma-HCH transport system ATP-binding protein